MRLNSPLRNFFDGLRSLIYQRQLAKRPKVHRFIALEKPVEVITDHWGVPHIYAQTATDLFFAQGFVTARDRLFQLDYNRHAIRGRLCELVGRKTLPWQKSSATRGRSSLSYLIRSSSSRHRWYSISRKYSGCRATVPSFSPK